MTAHREPFALDSSSLFAHAMALHRQHPHAPLPRDGYPFPDDAAHRGRHHSSSRDRSKRGADVAELLDQTLAQPAAEPAQLLVAFHGLDVPIHHNEHIAAAALRADADDVTRLGRYLVRHSPDRCSVTVGLSLLAAGHDDRDIPLLQTIGLLSDVFSPLVCHALKKRRSGGGALEWLAPRVDGWGRVYPVEALCERMTPSARHWLLRHGCSDTMLSGYFAGKIATRADLHTAITTEHDDDLVDHTTRLLLVMATCHGQSLTLDEYPAAPAVLRAHAARISTLPPTPPRLLTLIMLTDALSGTDPHGSLRDKALGAAIAPTYTALLHSADWQASLHALHSDKGSEYEGWVLDVVARRLGLLDTPRTTG